LTLLAARDSKADRSRLAAHYMGASNMTDEAHALYLLAGSPNAERERALQNFYERWQHDHIVIDTWFAAQAIAPMAKTLARVRALTRHRLFSLTAPNKVRALIGSFAAMNPVQFNRPDGQGYAFVADQVLALDRFNPQVAARILGSFRSWRSLEPGRRSKAKTVLRHVAKTEGLSRDVYEIVHKMTE
jgi:aminopeptidase N